MTMVTGQSDACYDLRHAEATGCRLAFVIVRFRAMGKPIEAICFIIASSDGCPVTKLLT